MDNISDFYNLIPTEFSSAIIVFNILFSFVLQIGIVWVYKKTHNTLSYSQSFVMSMVMIGILGSVVMMIVQNNIVGAFALLGAFSLIRFRTVVKESRDVAFVFFALAMGVAVGTENYAVAFWGEIMVGAIILLFHHYRLGSARDDFGFLMTVVTENSFNPDIFKKVFSAYSADGQLMQIKNRGGASEYIYSIKLKDDSRIPIIAEELKKYPAIVDLEFITGKHSAEY